eukprot:scaffold70233_cov63-Phaeocystis_antarctica.AAC.5
MADTTAARPAALQRRMAAMKVEQDEEIEMLEDARRRAQSAGESIEAQLDIENTVNKGLRSELRIAEAARDDARRSVDVVDQRSVDLKRDLRSARFELEVPAPLSAPSLGALPWRPIAPSTRLQTLRLEISRLRPYEAKPLPTTAALRRYAAQQELEHAELQPPGPSGPAGVAVYGGEAAGGGEGDGGGGLGDGGDGGEGGCVNDALRTHCIARGRCGRGTQLNRSPRRPREARCVWVFTFENVRVRVSSKWSQA